jgi:hypothetical protein
LNTAQNTRLIAIETLNRIPDQNINEIRNLIPMNVKKKVEREESVTKEMIEKVTFVNHESNAKIIKMLEDERKLALGPEVNSRALKPMSRTAGLRYVSLVAPVVIRNPDIQSLRRLDAEDDEYPREQLLQRYEHLQ